MKKTLWKPRDICECIFEYTYDPSIEEGRVHTIIQNIPCDWHRSLVNQPENHYMSLQTECRVKQSVLATLFETLPDQFLTKEIIKGEESIELKKEPIWSYDNEKKLCCMVKGIDSSVKQNITDALTQRAQTKPIIFPVDVVGVSEVDHNEEIATKLLDVKLL